MHIIYVYMYIYIYIYIHTYATHAILANYFELWLASAISFNGARGHWD